MFDLGIQELIVIFVVALLVFGPKRLPELSRTLGKGVRELKIALRGIKDSFDEAVSLEEKDGAEGFQAGYPKEPRNKAEPSIQDRKDARDAPEGKREGKDR